MNMYCVAHPCDTGLHTGLHTGLPVRRVRIALVVWLPMASLAPVALAAPNLPLTALPEVTIIAKSDALSAQRAAVTQKTVLDRAEIESLGGLTVGEVIRKLPGVDAGEQGGDGGMSARARGMARDSVQFLVNGERPTANARFALTQVGRMPAGELEKIEILRGSSAEFGGAAPVTVNLVMRRPVATASSSLKLAAGQRGDEANGQFSFTRSGGEGNFAWLMPVTVNHHGMPIEQHFQRQTTMAGSPVVAQTEHEQGDYTIDELILSPRLAWKSGGDSLTLWPSLYRNAGERQSNVERVALASAAGPSNVASGRRDLEENATRIARLRADGELRAGTGKLVGRSAVMSGRRSADRLRAPWSAAGPIPAWNETERRQDGEFSAALRYDVPLGAEDPPAHFASLGLEFARHRRDDQQHYNGSVVAAQTFTGRERQWSAWLQDEWRLASDLTLTSGLRGNGVWLETQGRSRRTRHGALDPSLSLRWDAASGWVARASAGGSLRVPKLDELTSIASRSASANSPLEPDRGGNPDLRPERIVNLELGIERSVMAAAAGSERTVTTSAASTSTAGLLGANLYLRRTGDFIERRLGFDGLRWFDRPYNEGTALHWGLELSAKLRGDAGLVWLALPKSASLRANLTLPRGKVHDDRLGVRRGVREMPSHTASVGYEQSLPGWQGNFGFQWQRNGATRTRVAGGQSGYGYSDYSVDGRARNLLDVHVVHRLDARFNLRLAVQNLLRADTQRMARAAYATPATPATPAAGLWTLGSDEPGQRTWLLSLEGKW
jgi:outer membrane receptor for ferrienterochelin and colicins